MLGLVANIDWRCEGVHPAGIWPRLPAPAYPHRGHTLLQGIYALPAGASLSKEMPGILDVQLTSP